MGVIRDYNEAVLTKLQAVRAADGRGREVTIPGLATPVPCNYGQPAEWLKKYELPYLWVQRRSEAPDPGRHLPGFKFMAPVAGDPSLVEIQRVPSQPQVVLYEVWAEAETQAVLDLLTEHVMGVLPLYGYGSVITVYGHLIPVRGQATSTMERANKETALETREGRKLVRVFSYAVEAWHVDPACDPVPAVLQIVVGPGEELP